VKVNSFLYFIGINLFHNKEESIMKKIKYPFNATTFNQFKIRYTIFSLFFGILLIILFIVRGNSFNLWQKLPFQNNYQILSFLLIIFYCVVNIYIYNIYKKNFLSKSKRKKSGF
jgi:uncharacterized membrane protein